MREIELLAPAKTADAGIEAISHGADAVYIGAGHHGARAAACNSVEDIGRLCDYAHRFMARVYVTLNTIIYDHELDSVRQLLCQLAEVRVDAVLVQDMAIVEMVYSAPSDNALSYFRGRLHASTQTDNRTAEKVEWLRNIGFGRVVLARELSVEEIEAINSRVPDVELEAFVHGALCVSYSGLCYASQHCFHRSANRGECAQFCRMKFDLVDADRQTVKSQSHILSLKDMCQADNLERLLDAGVCSLKIEGRLKDISYVKNVVAAYNKRLNEIIARHTDRYRRSSIGACTYNFEPDLAKTFNRGYTNYFLNGRTADISSPETPKSKGKPVGHVKEIRGGSFTVSGMEPFANGDGLCYVGSDSELVGFRVNKVVNNRIFPLKMPTGLRPGMLLYRNKDMAFEKLLSGNSAERKIDVRMRLSLTADGVELRMGCSPCVEVSAHIEIEHQPAAKPQLANMQTQLGKLGNTNYSAKSIDIAQDVEALFIPSSRLAELRRLAVAKLDELIATTAENKPSVQKAESESSDTARVPAGIYGENHYLYNVANHLAADFYRRHGLTDFGMAYEKTSPRGVAIMQCRYCIRHEMGFCVKRGGRRPAWREPLHIVLGDGRSFRLGFDCSKCQMNVYDESK